MGQKIDLIGKVFGKLTVVAEHPERKNKKIYWVCKCECGKEKIISGSDLKSGRTLSCGCLKTDKQKIKDMIGKRFNRLVVLEETSERKHGSIVWKCQCDCGNITFVSTGNLNSGGTSSCGCLKKEKDGKIIKLNLLGKKFGLLTVIEETKERKNNHVVWKCKCECGNIINVSSDSLQRGYRLSCGCLKESYGIRTIKDILINNNISFICEKTFPNCIFPETQKKLRFDLYVENKYLIEFDGEQHYHYTLNPKSSSWNNEEHYLKLKARDEYKNNWCKNNHIPLIRIPYYIKNITLEDLLLETTKYQVV